MPRANNKGPAPISPKDLFGDEELPATGPKKPRGGTGRRERRSQARPRKVVTLVVERGTHAGREVELPPEGGRMGRSSKNELCLRGAPGVSRHHASVEFEGGTYWIVDTGSRNGVVVNGVEIEGKTSLADGDLVELSDEVIRVRIGEPRGPARPPPPPAEALLGPDEGVDTEPAPRSPGPGELAPRAPLGLEAAAALLADGPLEEPIPLETKKRPSPPFHDGGGLPPPAAPLSMPLGGTAEGSYSQSQSAPMLPLDALEPLGPPQDSFSAGPPLGLPPEDPYGAQASDIALTPPALPRSPPARRGSVGMFVVGGLVGLALALTVVGGGDQLLNEGRLRHELFTKANAHLAPLGVQLPSFSSLLGGGDETAPAPDEPPPPDADAPPTDPSGVAPADAPKAPEGKRVRVQLEAEKAAAIASVSRRADADIKSGEMLAFVYYGPVDLLKRWQALQTELTRLKAQAKRKGKKGKKAKKRLASAKSEMTELTAKLEKKTLTAPGEGRVLSVAVRPNDVVDAGRVLFVLDVVAPE